MNTTDWSNWQMPKTISGPPAQDGSVLGFSASTAGTEPILRSLNSWRTG
jgi:hypothetical protein